MLIFYCTKLKKGGKKRKRLLKKGQALTAALGITENCVAAVCA